MTSDREKVIAIDTRDAAAFAEAQIPVASISKARGRFAPSSRWKRQAFEGFGSTSGGGTNHRGTTICRSGKAIRSVVQHSSVSCCRARSIARFFWMACLVASSSLACDLCCGTV